MPLANNCWHLMFKLMPTVKMNEGGYIPTDEYEKTNLDHIFAIGDVNGKMELTPVAIAAGRKLADRLFGGPVHAKARLDYSFVPTVIFNHPPIGDRRFAFTWVPRLMPDVRNGWPGGRRSAGNVWIREHTHLPIVVHEHVLLGVRT